MIVNITEIKLRIYSFSAVTVRSPVVGDPRSRGVRVHKLLDNKTWLMSPEFLWKVKETWMHCKVESTIEDAYSTLAQPVSSLCITLIGRD